MRQRCCARDAFGRDFDEEELIGWVVIDRAAEKGEENEEAGTQDENQRDETQKRS